MEKVKNTANTIRDLLDQPLKLENEFWNINDEEYAKRDLDIIIAGLFGIDSTEENYVGMLKYVFITRGSKLVFSNNIDSPYEGYVNIISQEILETQKEENTKNFIIMLKRGKTITRLSTKTEKTFDLFLKYLKFLTIQENFKENYENPKMVDRYDNLLYCKVQEKTTNQILFATIYNQEFIKKYPKQVKQHIVNIRSLTDPRLMKVKSIYILKEDLILVQEPQDEKMMSLKNYIDELNQISEKKKVNITADLMMQQQLIEIQMKKLELIIKDIYLLQKYLKKEGFILREIKPNDIYLRIFDNNKLCIL